jgi:hypothetical protein
MEDSSHGVEEKKSTRNGATPFFFWIGCGLSILTIRYSTGQVVWLKNVTSATVLLSLVLIAVIWVVRMKLQLKLGTPIPPTYRPFFMNSIFNLIILLCGHLVGLTVLQAFSWSL